MKIYTRIVRDMTQPGMPIVEADSYEHPGPIAEAKGDKGGSCAPPPSTPYTYDPNANMQGGIGALAGMGNSFNTGPTAGSPVNPATVGMAAPNPQIVQQGGSATNPTNGYVNGGAPANYVNPMDLVTQQSNNLPITMYDPANQIRRS